MATQRAADRFTIVDADAHYHTDFEDLASYIDDDDPWKYRFLRGQDREDANMNNSKFFPKVTGSVQYSSRESISPFDPIDSAPDRMLTRQDVKETMAGLGIDVAILLSNNMLAFGLMRLDDRRQSVFANAYTDYMLDKVVEPSSGIFTTIPLPYQQPDEAAELIDRVKHEDGIIGLSFITASPPMGHRKYDVIYEAASDADLPIVFHSGLAYSDQFHQDGFSSYLSTHSLGFAWENMAQATSVTIQGVPEKYPKLDFVFQEAGIFWVPQVMYRLDMEYLRNEDDAPLLTRRPSEYMQTYYYCTQPLEVPPKQRYYEYVIEMLGGPERLIYASDYPHSDYDDPSAITDLSFLSDAEKAKVLGENAMEVFDI